MGNGLKITLVVLLSIITIGLIGLLSVMLVRGEKFEFVFATSAKLIEEKTIEDIKDINVNVNYVDIEINESDDEVINVKIYSDNASSHSIKDGETLDVELKEKSKFISLFSRGPKIVITVPKYYDKKVNVKGDVLDVRGTGCENLILYTDFSTGDVKVEEMNIANIKLSTGDVKLEKVNDLVVSHSTGDIKVREVNKSINIKSNVGDIKIENLYIEEDGLIKLSTGDVKISKVNSIYVDAKTDVGDIRIQGTDRKSDIVLTITNHIGDVKVG